MSVYERNGYWYAEVPLPNGKKLKRSVGKKGIVTKAMARQVEQDLKRKIKLGQWDMIQAEIPTFNEFIPEYIDYQKNIKRTRDWYRSEYSVKLFAKYYGDKKLSEITSNDIDDYKRLRLGEGKQPATVNREIGSVRSLIFLAKKRKRFFGENPVSDAGLLPVNNQKERILTLDEEKRLLECCRDFLRPRVLMALHTGMRSSEIRTIKWSNVDFNTNTITIDMVNSKNKRTRFIPINQVLRKVLLEQKLQTGNSEYVFGKWALRSRINHDYYFVLACKEAGIQGLRFHDLRHTAATRMIEAGVSIVAVSKLLGHADIKMTMRYSHPDNSLREAVETLAKFTNSTTNIATSENLSDSN